jgi:hypothetical protein
MPELDDDYQQRAAKLVKEAKKKAYSNWKFGPAKRQYINMETLKRVGGGAAGSVLVSTVAHACAGAAVAAGLVGVSAATFGLGPAVGVVLTYALFKGLAEYKYQRTNDALKKGVELDEDGQHLTIRDASLLGPLIAKVLKKYERVQRAAAQAGAYGTWAHVKSSVRHAKTALRGFGKDHDLVETRATLFPGLKYNDHELSDRLYELRFYAQMLFNYVEWIADTVAVRKRNAVADACQIIYSHVLRQVHVTGNHAHCDKCYSMTPDQVQAVLKALEATHQKLMPPQEAAIKAKDPSFRAEVGADKRLAKKRLGQNLAALQGGPAADAQLKPVANDKIAKWMFRGAVGGGEVIAGVQFINQETLHVSAVNAKDVAASAGQAAAQGAQAGAETAGVGVAVAELMRTITNRLTKRSVLNPRRLRGAFNLLAESNEARQEAFGEFSRLMAKHNVISRAPRVGEKIVWYIDKVSKIQDDFNRAYDRMLHKGDNYDTSAFATYDDAYALVYNANYFFRNCEKFIAFLVYLEAILLQIDQVVSAIPKIGIGLRAIVEPGRKTPPQPVTVKGFGADWDQEKSILPWK